MADWRQRIGCFLSPPFHHRWDLVESRKEGRQDPLFNKGSQLDPTMGQFESHDIRCRRCGTEKSFIHSNASVQFGRKN
jgi:hypothetical protein